MVFFNPNIGGKAPVSPIASNGAGNVGGAGKASPLKQSGVDAFTPSFGAAPASSASSSSIADIVANVGKLSNADARAQLSKGTQAGLDSFASIHDAL